VLIGATERFPQDTGPWSALGELYLRVGHLDIAVATFEEGLRVDPRNRYLLPGYVRALGVSGRDDDAREALHQAQEARGVPAWILERRERELAKGSFNIVPIPELRLEWRDELSVDALGELGLLLRRARERGDIPTGSRANAEVLRTDVSARLQGRQGLGVAAAAASFLNTGASESGPVPAALHEVARVREERGRLHGTAYESDAFESLTVDSNRAGAEDLRLEPLVELSRVRAAAALVDGSVLQEHGQRALASLSLVAQSGQNGDREYGLARKRSIWSSVVLTALADHSRDLPVELPQLREVVESRERQLNDLEEDLALSLSSVS
jgi:hypothetical protein